MQYHDRTWPVQLRHVVPAALLLLAGCTTHLIVKPPAPNQKEPVVGHVYSLPRVDHQLTVERELTDCRYGYKDEEAIVLAWLAAFGKAMDDEKQPKTEQQIDAAVRNVLVQLDALSPEVKSLVDLALGNGMRPAAEFAARGEKGQRQAFLARLRALADEPVIEVKVQLRASALPLVSADSRQTYAINYLETQSPTKVTDMTFENHANGTLKSVNVTIDDQTGDLIQNALSGVAKIAMATAGLPLPVDAHNAMLVSNFTLKTWREGRAVALAGNNPCATWVQSKLAQRKALSAVVDAGERGVQQKRADADKAASLLAETLARRDKQKTVVDEMQVDDPKKVAAKLALGTMDAAVKTAQAAETKTKQALADALNASAAPEQKLATVRKTLTSTTLTMLRWEHPDAVNTVIPGIDEAIAAWFDKGRIDLLCANASAYCAAQFQLIREQLAVQAAIYPRGKNYQDVAWSEHQAHLVYRQPLQSFLFVCKGMPCLDIAGQIQATPDSRLLEMPVAIPQLGLMASLPLINGAFQNNTIVASFTETGVLTKSAYKSNAAAVKGAAVFEQSADTFMKFREAKRQQGTAKIEQQKNEVDAETALLKSQLELEKAKAELKKQRGMIIDAGA